MAKNEKNVKEKKKNSHYFKDMKAELKKVIWPSSKQTINNTLAVIVFTLIAAVIVFVLDVCFDSLNKYAVTPLQDKIQSSYRASHQEESTTEENTEANSVEENKSSENNETKKGENTEATDEANIKVENTQN